MKSFQDYLEQEDEEDGGYVAYFDMSPELKDYDKGVKLIKKAFGIWKDMPATEKSDHNKAIKEICQNITAELE